MKLIFFLVGFCLISLRAYFSWSQKDMKNKGISEFHVRISSDDLTEDIKYYGKLELTDNDSAFKFISPGGYFLFQRNDQKVQARGNVNGSIDYTITDGPKNLGMDADGKKLLADAIHQMIGWGYDVNNRIERLFQKGGADALLQAVDSLYSDQTKIMYLDHVFTIDSLHTTQKSLAIAKINSIQADQYKRDRLRGLHGTDLQDTSVSMAYFSALEGIQSDWDKASLLKDLVEKDSLTIRNLDTVLRISSRLSSDVDRTALYQKIMESEHFTGARFDSLLIYISRIGSDNDKKTLYEQIASQAGIAEYQWTNLISFTEQLGSDMDKTQLLVAIASKLPENAVLKSQYMKAAKTIENDGDYGQAIRAIEQKN